MATKSAELAAHFSTLEQQHEAGLLGMWVFLATELMVFGALFTGYTVYRSAYAREFEAGSAALNVWFGGCNTAVLLASSLTMALAVYGAHVGNRRMLLLCLGMTAFLGTLFLVIKGFEYRGDFVDRLVPGLSFDDAEWRTRPLPLDPGKVKLFLLFYYIMTGLHAVHLIIGIALMGVLYFEVWKWYPAAPNATNGEGAAVIGGRIEVSGLYWHFVDVIWIFLLPLLYLIGQR